MRKLLLFAGLLALGAPPAAASPFRLHIRGKAPAAAANLIPGANAGGSGWALLAAPAAVGSSGDEGYASPAVAHWTQPQQRVIRTGESFHPGIDAAHTPTAAENIGGVQSNICEVDFAVDGGATLRVMSESLNPDTGRVDWHPTVRESDFVTTGPHEIRATVIPCTGVPLLMQGDYPIANLGNPFGLGSGAISGTALTVSSWGGKQWLRVGSGIMGKGVAPNTYVTADTGGGGGDGTYTVNVSQNVSAEEMQANAAPSMLFYTSRSSAIPQRIVYVSTSGNDSTGTGASATPFRTLLKAVNPGFGNDGTEEWYFCLAAGTYPITGATAGPGKANPLYWGHVQPSTMAPCDGTGGGTKANVILDMTTGYVAGNNLGMTQTQFNSVTMINARGISSYDNFGSGSTRTGSFLWFQNVDYTGIGFNAIIDGAGGGSAGMYCIDSTFRLTGNGCNNKGLIIAGSTFDKISVDVLSNSFYAVSNTITNQGPMPGTGSVVSGSTDVTGLTFNTNLLGVGQPFGTLANSAFPIPDCQAVPPFPFTVASILSSSSVRLDHAAVATETAAPMGVTCGHSDTDQEEFPIWNVLIKNNDSSSPTNHYGRGVNSGQGAVGRWAIIGNTWYMDGGSTVWELEADYHEDILVAGNTFNGTVFLNTGKTYVRNFYLNNVCLSGAPTHTTGQTYRGNTGC